jgi:YVTN family beta-propeller protein
MLRATAMIDDGPRAFRPGNIGRHSSPPAGRDVARAQRPQLAAFPARRSTRTVRASRSRPPGPLIAALAAAVLLAAAAPAHAQGTFVNWESPPVHPVDMTPDGSTLLVVNTADARLEIFALGGALPVHTASVPVGLDPVSVRARSNGEAWVVNRISDSVSIVDLATRNVVATLLPGDEPADVIFAGSPQRAFVSVSMQDQVDVYDPANRGAAPTVVPIAGKDPRALATDGTRVFVAIFQSGNRSMILPESKVSSGSSPYGGVNPPPNSGASFNPPLAPGLPPPPPTSLIVNKEGVNWKDDNNHLWDALVTWNLNENDVALIDVSSLTVSYQRNLLNIDMALAVQPGTGYVTVVGTYGPNEHRFEESARNSFQRNRIATFNPANLNGPAPALDMNQHLLINPPMQPYKTTATPQERHLSLADPRGIVWNAAGTGAYVSGMGSNNVVKTNSMGTRLATIDVGEGPTGLALDVARSRLYCLNRFSATVSVIDTGNDTELAQVAFFDPTPASVKQGRPLLYDAHRTSQLGNASCAGCHVDATRDTEAWDLGDPAGALDPLAAPCNSGLPFAGPCNDPHPMKGPMMTQTLIGAVGTEPLHWRGDRKDLSAFTVGFTGLLGADAPPSPAEMKQLETFLASIRFPPNPFRTFDDQLPASVPGFTGNPANGETLFTSASRFSGGLKCVDCHATPSGAAATLVSADVRGDAQAFKVPQLRDLYKKTGLSFTSSTNKRGFGYLHDGSADTIFTLLKDPAFTFAAGSGGDAERRDLEAFLMCFPTDTHPAVGTQLTIDGTNKSQQQVLDRIAQMIALADAGDVGIVAKGRIAGLQRGLVYLAGTGTFQSDRLAEVVGATTLRQAAATGAEITLTVVPAGTETRAGVDRDGDAYLDRDELDAGSDPADATSVPQNASTPADADSDAVPDLTDDCPSVADPAQADTDADGVGDACDDCVAARDVAQVDADSDGVGDACDACNGGAAMTLARLRVRHLLGAGGQSLRLIGDVTVPSSPAIDPAGNGLRVLVRDALGASLLDVSVPKGAGWTFDPLTPSWVYASASGFAGITKVAVSALAGAPGSYHVRIIGNSLKLPVTQAALPLAATVVLDVPQASAGQCGDARFPGPAPAPRCRIRHGGTRLICGT